MSLPATVAFVPVTWAAETLIGVLGLIPSMAKLPCRSLNVALPVADMQAAEDCWAVSPCSLVSWQYALRLPAATWCIQFTSAAPGVLSPSAAVPVAEPEAEAGLAPELTVVPVLTVVPEAADAVSPLHALTQHAAARAADSVMAA
jgi:hypothetical protein